MELMICPLCREDYLLGKGKLLRIDYLKRQRAVDVCPTCAKSPPGDYETVLRRALDEYPWDTDLEENEDS